MYLVERAGKSSVDSAGFLVFNDCCLILMARSDRDWNRNTDIAALAKTDLDALHSFVVGSVFKNNSPPPPLDLL